MNKILTFVVNENNEILLLQGSDQDPQFHKSLWYVITGGCEDEDINKEETVAREVMEETGLKVKDTFYLNWIFKYISLGEECIEYAYISHVDKAEIKLNEENIGYRWYSLDDFIKNTYWFGDRTNLREVLRMGLNNKLFFETEKIEDLR